MEQYSDFSTVNLDIGEQFLGEVLRRSKEILNYIRREDGNTLYDALKVFYKFFAKEDGVLQTEELCHMLNFLKLPNDVLSPLLDECIDELRKKDPENKTDYHFEQTLDVLEKYEIIQQFELNEYEKEAVFNCQFFLRVLHELGLVDLRKNYKNFNEDEYERQRATHRQNAEDDNDDNDELIDRNIEVEEVPDYHITDVNDLIYPLPKGYNRVFWKGYTYEKEMVVYFG